MPATESKEKHMSVDGPLKWFGGKAYLAKRIVALMPPHLHYVEPYAGGLSVLLERDPKDTSEVVNDLNFELTNFWNVLQRPDWFAVFEREMSAKPFSEWEYQAAKIIGRASGVAGPHTAISFFVRCRQSRAGQFKDFATLSRTRTRRGMNEQASAWLTTVEGLPAVHARLKRVVILNRDALDVIRQQDGPATLFYLDPPYLHETRVSKDVYAHEMTAEQHQQLMNVLIGVEGKFMLSGYRSKLYDSYADAYKWTRHDFELPNNAAGGKEKRRMTECVWCNFPPPSAGGQQ